MSRELSQREKLILFGGGVVLALLMVMFGLVVPSRATMAEMEQAIATQKQRLGEVAQLRATYLALRQQTDRLQKDLARSAPPAPLTFLEEAAARGAGREKLVLMRPLPAVVQDSLRIESIEFKLERVELEQALRVLWEIENARPPMRIDKLYFRERYDNPAQLDMSATVSAARRS